MELDLIVTNTTIITGDGTTIHPNGQIGIADGKIAAISVGQEQLSMFGIPRLDARGATSFPGLINGHAHGCVHGPAMPSGSKPLDPSDVRYFRNRHLLGGTTTLLNVCGLSLPHEVDSSLQGPHPLRTFVTTAHTASSVSAALEVDGSGLRSHHLRATVEEAIASGAVALGEGGGGQTLGGGAQDYGFLPQAILETTGILVEARDARRLKELLLGRTLKDPTFPLNAQFIALCDELDLLSRSTSETVAKTIAGSVMKPVKNALLGLAELAEASARTGLPAILHSAAPSAEHILDLARAMPSARLIAAHCNHPSFTPEEAVATARLLRDTGVLIDVSTLDCISTHWRNTAENLDALIGEGLVDTLSTDFAGGHWDGILEAVHRMIVSGQMSAPMAIALATGNVASAFGAFHDAGRLEVGKRADITIADSLNLSRVRHVIIGGKRVVGDGAINEAGQDND
ncbi:amidohydrolase family protein (plasmid) [Devosia neptuniae]|uniref:Amidohydrolase family protein n=1 Tax=Devosia neptuniae TaxID=191302 RepID=A0ABY6C7G1_9HYPH|nr:amidohydrolase family protein [Devosia neptuniae]